MMKKTNNTNKYSAKNKKTLYAKDLKKDIKKDIIIISVGGSLIVPDNVDIAFLKDFRNLVLKHLKDKTFILIAGGGKTARTYQNAAREVLTLDNEDADWLGIHATHLNAHLLRTIFKNEAYPRVIYDPTEKLDASTPYPVYVAAGWKPGCSTDYDAVLLAKNVGAKTIINLSNTDYVYDKDPRRYSDAKKIESISWKDFRKIVGDKWDPGLNAPFDPIASKESEKLKLKVLIMNGKNISNIDNFLKGKKFDGTVIQ